MLSPERLSSGAWNSCIGACSNSSGKRLQYLRAYLILVTTATTTVEYFFQAGILFTTKNEKGLLSLKLFKRIQTQILIFLSAQISNVPSHVTIIHTIQNEKDNDIDFSVFVQRQFYCKLAHFLTYNLKKNRLVNFISVLFIFIGVPSVISGPMISQSTFGPKIWRMNIYYLCSLCGFYECALPANFLT